METDYSFIWVLLIAAIGIAVSVYSLCKGCKGYSDRGIGARALVAPYAGLLQQMRAEAASRRGLFSISGNSVGDKDPPTYDELFAAPPPSYDESLRMLQGGFNNNADKANNNNIDKESCSKEEEKSNKCEKDSHSAEMQSTAEVGQYTQSDTRAEHVTVVMQEEEEESDELARRRSSTAEIAPTHITSIVVINIEAEMQRHSV